MKTPYEGYISGCFLCDVYLRLPEWFWNVCAILGEAESEGFLKSEKATAVLRSQIEMCALCWFVGLCAHEDCTACIPCGTSVMGCASLVCEASERSLASEVAFSLVSCLTLRYICCWWCMWCV